MDQSTFAAAQIWAFIGVAQISSTVDNERYSCFIKSVSTDYFLAVAAEGEYFFMGLI